MTGPPDAVGPAESVRLTGLSPRELVEAAERLREQGRPAILDLTGQPAVARAIGRLGQRPEHVVLPAASPTGTAIRRARDLLVAAGLLAGLSPLFGALAALVKLSSPGPVFFATTVIGHDGRPFSWRKFRSMTVGEPPDIAWRRERYRAYIAGDPPSTLAGHVKIVDESRITRIGRVMRRHSLDELPQLWNVLRGEMTLVGPRPCLPYEYDLQAPWHRLRYRVTPGLTGPWQVFGRSRMSMDEMALLDYCYGRIASFGLDLRLVWRTLAVMLNGDGAI